MKQSGGFIYGSEFIDTCTGCTCEVESTSDYYKCKECGYIGINCGKCYELMGGCITEKGLCAMVEVSLRVKANAIIERHAKMLDDINGISDYEKSAVANVVRCRFKR